MGGRGAKEEEEEEEEEEFIQNLAHSCGAIPHEIGPAQEECGIRTGVEEGRWQPIGARGKASARVFFGERESNVII